MSFPIILLALLPICSTFIGGFVVYKWRRDLHPWLSLSGGVLLGVAFLDLLPEAFATGFRNGLSPQIVGATGLAAILLFHILDKIVPVHGHHEHVPGVPAEPCSNELHHEHLFSSEGRAWIRASGFVIHSFFDGLAIGGSFLIDPKLGLLIVFAVIMHDFSDGMSTVTVLRNALGPHRKQSALVMLGIDALSPFIGALVGIRLAPSGGSIALMLAFFSGFFIFLSLSELLPQAHAQTNSRQQSLALTVLGIAIIAIIQRVAFV
jgi:zinc transporter, ZIP family